MKSKAWATFLRIPPPETSDLVPALDANWLAARGIHSASPIVLALLKQHVLPLVQRLNNKLADYHFLVHDRASGVPTSEDDNAAYIHLRLFFKKAASLDSLRLPVGVFSLTRPCTDIEEEQVGGIDYSIIVGKSVREKNLVVRMILSTQSALIIGILTAHAWTDGADMVRQMRQLGHYLANMTQMRFE